MRRLLYLAACACLGQEPANIRVDVNLVTVACSALDRNRVPVQNLRKEDFTLVDDGSPREIQYFWQERDLPLTIGLIVDVSGSQSGEIRRHRETIMQFLRQVIGPQDRAFLVTVGPEVRLVTDLTNSMDDLSAGVEAIQFRSKSGVQLGEPCRGADSPLSRHRRGLRRIIPGCGGTALWNGIYAAAKLKMKSNAGRKALIVLSDGMDTGSFHNLTDAIEAAQSADTLVYTLHSLSPAVMAMMAPLAVRGASNMRRLAVETGGQAFASSRNVSAIFLEIENQLRNLYVLGFLSPDGAREGEYHKLEVKPAKANVTIRARKGYTVTHTKTE